MYGYGYQYGKFSLTNGSATSQIFDDYLARVEADGGTVENNVCTIRFIISIGGNLASALYNAYELRVLADSGEIENKNCLISNLRELI